NDNRLPDVARAVTPIFAVVFLGLDQRRRAGGVHQRRSGAPFRDPEIQNPLLWRGLERRGAARRHRVDAVSVRWRAAMVYVSRSVKRRVLRSTGRQALRCWSLVRVPPLL